jgi:serine/threonine protein kinase
MEFVEGRTLEQLIKRSGRLEVKRALDIAAQVAAGLAAVHRQKLVHRDIKPSNIMVSAEEGGTVTVKIIDLGLAKAAPDAPSQAAISTPGAFAGTPEFASPEQFAGVSVDIRSDLYSLGVVLWEMVTGQVVFRGSPAEVMYQHQHAPLPLEPLNDLPQPAVVLLKVLLEKDPRLRLQSPVELFKAIEEVRDAIRVGRSVPEKGLRAISNQQPAALQKSAIFSRKLGALLISPKIPFIRWQVVFLLIAAAVILMPSPFPGIRHRAGESPVTPVETEKATEKSEAVLPLQRPNSTKRDSNSADGAQDEVRFQDALAFFERGLAKEKKGDLDGAMADYNQAIKLNPKSALAYNDRGNTKSSQGDLGGAMTDYNQAIKLDPRLAFPYNGRGYVRQKTGDLDGAMADFNYAIQLNPQFGLAYRNRGNAKRQKGDFDGAIADFDRAIKFSPQPGSGKVWPW